MLASLAEKERLASVGMLAASVAHEIMNPLTYVLANLDFVVGERRTTRRATRRRSSRRARARAACSRSCGTCARSVARVARSSSTSTHGRVLEIALRLSGPEVARTVERGARARRGARRARERVAPLPGVHQPPRQRRAGDGESRRRRSRDPRQDAARRGREPRRHRRRRHTARASPRSASRASSSRSSRRSLPAPASGSRSAATSSSAWADGSTSTSTVGAGTTFTVWLSTTREVDRTASAHARRSER